MILTFFPQRRDDRLEVQRAGDVLTLNGTALDFGPLPAGGVLPREAVDSPWIAGDVRRLPDGRLEVPLLLPYGPDAPHETRFPLPLILDGDGPVALPAWGAPESEPETEDAPA